MYEFKIQCYCLYFNASTYCYRKGKGLDRQSDTLNEKYLFIYLFRHLGNGANDFAICGLLD